MISQNSFSEASWEKSVRPKFMDNASVFNLKQVEDLLRFVVSNTFLKNGNEIRRQCIGVPMGTNSAPALAIYIYTVMSQIGSRKKLLKILRWHNLFIFPFG